jgi:ribosomal protein L37E
LQAGGQGFESPHLHPPPPDRAPPSIHPPRARAAPESASCLPNVCLWAYGAAPASPAAPVRLRSFPRVSWLLPLSRHTFRLRRLRRLRRRCGPRVLPGAGVPPLLRAAWFGLRLALWPLWFLVPELNPFARADVEVRIEADPAEGSPSPPAGGREDLPEAVRCPRCGAGHHPAASYCQVCGTPLRPAQRGPMPRGSAGTIPRASPSPHDQPARRRR